MTKEYMKSNRSPFEIRTNLLEIAQNYLQKQWEANNELARATFLDAMRTGIAAQHDWEKYAPKYFDFSEITKKAQELYGFVQNKD